MVSEIRVSRHHSTIECPIILIQVNDSCVLGDYTYNGYGERSVKTVQGVTTVFFYDKERTMISESDGIDFREYIYVDKLPIAHAFGTDVFFILADHVDTPAIMTDASGTSVWQIETQPYGDAENVTGTATLNLRFPGQYHDDESGMNYNYFRNYRPDLGRFLEADPLGFVGGANVYAYVASDPINLIDPLGLAPMTNNSGRCIPYKHENESGMVRCCPPGETCDVDGVYPPACDDFPIKVTNGCKAEATADGQLVVVCPTVVPRLAMRFTGGRTNEDFHDEHSDWPRPNNQPDCGCQAGEPPEPQER